jgi:L-lactate dehydrogenase (cytochrome)
MWDVSGTSGAAPVWAALMHDRHHQHRRPARAGAKRVPRMFYDYADSGSWTEGTYRANESDFQKIKLRQRVAVNMENRSTATTMVGQDVAMPVAIAPTGGLTGMQHADGEILAARAAEKFGIPFTLSTMSICSIEDVAAQGTPTRSGSSST